MTKRKDIIRDLKAAGFESCGGTKHEKFQHPDGRVTVVPRHAEVRESTARNIYRQAGLR